MPPTVVRELTTDSDGVRICAECGHPVEKTKGSQRIVNPDLFYVRLAVAFDELVTFGWKCDRHPYEIVLSHLRWAGVTAGDLVPDDRSYGPGAPPTTWQHPEGRRFWLKQHYESLVPDLYREATKPNTQLVYDILDCVRRHGTVTYEQLMEETGGAYRTVREHVSRLCEIGGEEPGILTKIQDACTFVAFSSRYFEEGANNALDQINPDDTPEDREERAEKRRERRREREEATDDQTDQSENEDDTNGQWRYFSQVPLTYDRARFARLEQQHSSAVSFFAPFDAER